MPPFRASLFTWGSSMRISQGRFVPLSPHPTSVMIPKGTRLTQLVSFKSSVRRTADQSHGAGGFGSTGPPPVHWTAVLTKDRPEMLCTLSVPGAVPSEIHLCGLLNSGTDVTVLSLAAWPLEWPLDPVGTSVTGLGATAQCYVSQQPVLVTNPEGQMAWVRPHVSSTPANLWGRDVLSLWGVCIETDF